MACGASSQSLWSTRNNAQLPNNSCNLSTSQLFPPLSFASYLDMVTADPSSLSEYSSFYKALCKSKLQQRRRHGMYNSSDALQSQVETLLDGLRQCNRRRENDEPSYPSYELYSSSRRHADSTGSGSSVSSQRRRVGPEGDTEDRPEPRQYCSTVYSSSKKSFSCATHSDKPALVPVSIFANQRQRCTLIPPRPRLSSPLTPHPHAPQPGLDLRRPLPNKRRRTEVPLTKRALLNCSNMEKTTSRSGLSVDRSKSDTVSLTVQDRSLDNGNRGYSVDPSFVTSSLPPIHLLNFESEFGSELSSGWVYIPSVPPTPYFVDDWELILKGDLYQYPMSIPFS